jgi:hypothetical protein
MRRIPSRTGSSAEAKPCGIKFVSENHSWNTADNAGKQKHSASHHCGEIVAEYRLFQDSQ